MAVIVDSSLLIDYLGGEAISVLEQATSAASLVMPPLVVAEVLSGELTSRQRLMMGELLQDFPLHPTPLAHWISVGSLRRTMRTHGINVTIPDAHVAQCALDLDATLLTRDDIFGRIAPHTSLRLAQLR